ncbi:MAG TPA: AAA family ATPase, partial [Chloroflexota bacterium]|nr:AAA family ATPase [Chloroflexota bacterium]
MTPNTVARWERAEMAIGAPELVRLALEHLGPGPPSPRTARPALHVRPTRDNRPASNLPAELSSFIGRERELAEVRRLLTASRLLTLTGAGGVGKTRLAQRVATEVKDSYADGVWLVALGSLRDPSLVPHAVAAVLGIHQHSQRLPAAMLQDALRGRDLLLVLDNCEHLIGACAELVEATLIAAPGLRVMTTSREPLGLLGETVWRVPSLGAPLPSASPTIDEVLSSEAGRLFVERARAVSASFVVDDHNAGSIARICQRLDGIPLALELAAARADVLPVEQLAQLLGNQLRLLVGSSRASPSRHRSLRAAIDWSHALLERQEQLLLRRLAVFAGGWTLASAERVCAGGELPAVDVLDALAGLARKSLVVADRAQGERRFRLLETVREFALEQLEAGAEAGLVHQRHAAYYLALAEAAEPHVAGPARRSWLERLDREHDNVRAALAWSQAAGQAETAIQLAGALGWFWFFQGYMSEGRGWLRAALSLTTEVAHPGEHATAIARALGVAGRLAHVQGDEAAARPLLENAAAHYGQLGDVRGLGYALTDLGQVATLEGNLEEASRLATESVALLRRTTDRWGLALALQDWAAVLLRQPTPERYAQAQVVYEEELAIFGELGDDWGRGLPLLGLGRVALGQGDFPEAQRLLDDARAIFESVADRRLLGFVLNRLGDLARIQHDFATAAAVYRENLEIWRSLAQPLGMAASLEGVAISI